MSQHEIMIQIQMLMNSFFSLSVTGRCLLQPRPLHIL